MLVLAASQAGCGSLLRKTPDPTRGEAAETAFAYLHPAPYRGLVVEVDYATGCRPSDAALEAMAEVLRRECRKPAGIEVLVDEEMKEVPPEAPVSDAWLRVLVQRYSNKMPTDGERAYLHVVSVPWFQERPEGKGSRGFCAPPLIALAREKLSSYAFLHITLSKIERAVLVHEVGHALGLVDNDEHENQGHCTNPTCVMYDSPDLRAILANAPGGLLGIVPSDFCSECRRDLGRSREVFPERP